MNIKNLLRKQYIKILSWIETKVTTEKQKYAEHKTSPSLGFAIYPNKVKTYNLSEFEDLLRIKQEPIEAWVELNGVGTRCPFWLEQSQITTNNHQFYNNFVKEFKIINY